MVEDVREHQLEKCKSSMQTRSIQEVINEEIENLLPGWVSSALNENLKIAKQISKEFSIFDDEFVTFEDASYSRQSKILKIGKVRIYGKKIIDIA